MKKYYNTANHIDVIVEYDKEEYEAVHIRLMNYDQVVSLVDEVSYNDNKVVKTAVNYLHQLASTFVSIANEIEEEKAALELEEKAKEKE